MPQVQRPCPVCCHARTTLAFDNAMAAVGGLDMSYTVGRCQHCGFHFAQQLADDASFERYYKSVSKYDVASRISDVDQARIDAAIEICRRHVSRHQRIVDLGCGYGALLGCLKQAGWTDLQGVDPAPKSSQRAKDMFGLDSIFTGTLESAHQVVALDQADVVCVMAVLEHLPNLRADMTALLSRLRPGCRLLIEVPAVEHFTAEGCEPFGEFSLEHIQFFSTASLQNFFASLGAKAIALETVYLPMVKSGSLFGLFELGGVATDSAPQPEPGEHFAQYVQQSQTALQTALARIPQHPFIIYGAGSHTARLLPQLEKSHGSQIVGVVDGNTNLIGKTIGRWTIQMPTLLESKPDTAVLISSFRSQNEIAVSLRQRLPNPLVLLYA